MNELTGTGALIQLILRRDRNVLLLWIVLLVLIVIGIAAAVPRAYPTAEIRQAFAKETSSSPAELISIGPVFSSSVGGIAAWRVRGIGALGMGLVGLLTLIRHTRVEEESGRRELLGSTVVGRHAALTAALVVVFGASLAMAALMAGGQISLGLPIAGSIALGLSIAAAGWMFAAMAAVAAQLTESAGAARGIALLVLGLFYILRAVGDVSGLSWLLWLSPLGWTEFIRPFANERWWPFVLVLLLTIILCTVAYVLSSRRDLGAGLLPARLGPATAAPGLRSPLSLAWRQHRGTLLAWSTGFAVIGAMLGGVGQSATNQLNANAQLRDVVARMGNGARPINSFFALTIYIIGQVVAMYAISATLRLRTEEVEMRADPVLATPTSRQRWAGGHLIIAVLGPVVILAVLGLSMGLTYGLSVSNVGYELPRLFVASIVRVFPVWVMVGIVAALYGLQPRLAAFVPWIVLGVFLLLELTVELKLASPSVLIISPFFITPSLPVTDLTVTPLILLVGVSVLLTVAGLVWLRQRDIG